MKLGAIVNAAHFAIQAHEKVAQKRKYTGEPYWIHPFEVAEMVGNTPGATVEMVCAALLHDVVEDTNYDLNDIKFHFGMTVCDLVYQLTDISKPEDGNRDLRKSIDRQHIREGTPEAKTIKLADLISNSRSIEQHDPDFAKVYMREKKLLLQALKEGDAMLYAKADAILHEYAAKNPGVL